MNPQAALVRVRSPPSRLFSRLALLCQRGGDYVRSALDQVGCGLAVACECELGRVVEVVSDGLGGVCDSVGRLFVRLGLQSIKGDDLLTCLPF